MNNVRIAAGYIVYSIAFIFVRKARIAGYTAIALTLAGIYYLIARLWVTMIEQKWDPEVTFWDLSGVTGSAWIPGYCVGVMVLGAIASVAVSVVEYMKSARTSTKGRRMIDTEMELVN